MEERRTMGDFVRGRVRRFVGAHWTVLALGLLIVIQIAISWLWLSTNVVVLGWDRPRHLIESLVYSDLLKQADFRSLFRAITYSGYYPPLFHLSVVGFYRLFGPSMDVAAAVNFVHLIVLLISSYGIGREIGGRGVGILAAFITSSLPMVFAMSRYTYIEFALTAMVTLSIWLLLLSRGFTSKRYSLLFGLSVGLGLLTKWTFSLFVFPALTIVLLRAGSLSGLRKGVRSFSLEKRWLAVSVGVGLILTLSWYLPNVQRVSELSLNSLLVPASWFLLGGMIYVTKEASERGGNLAGALFVAAVVAGSWYLTRIDFVDHAFLIAWGRPERHTWAFEYYWDRLVSEHFSLPYMILLIAAGVGLLVIRGKALAKSAYWRGAWRSDLFLLAVWIVVPYLVFSFRPSSRHSRFITPILPAAAVIMAYGLSKVRFHAARMLAIAAVVLFGSLQCLALSFDGLGWVRHAAVVELPAVGQVDFLAHNVQNQLPSSGPTDRGFWIVPAVLEYVATHGEEAEPVELGLLTNTQQLNEQHFQYIIYTDYQGQIRTRELALNLPNQRVYPQLNEVDYLLLMSDHPAHRIHPDSLRIVETILNDPPPEFQEAFRLIQSYPLPDGRVAYLYERRGTLAAAGSGKGPSLLAGAHMLDSRVGPGAGSVADLGPMCGEQRSVQECDRRPWKRRTGA
ncbi:MAG: glycosyltransferase family 39 protein [Anaerolineae bacterium]